MKGMLKKASDWFMANEVVNSVVNRIARWLDIDAMEKEVAAEKIIGTGTTEARQTIAKLFKKAKTNKWVGLAVRILCIIGTIGFGVIVVKCLIDLAPMIIAGCAIAFAIVIGIKVIGWMINKAFNAEPNNA
jgi:translation initiation factor 6 (eIF-6)